MLEDEELSRFQALLLDVLSQDLAPEVMHRRLLEAKAARPFSDYVRGFDLRSLEVAARITKKFGRRRD